MLFEFNIFDVIFNYFQILLHPIKYFFFKISICYLLMFWIVSISHNLNYGNNSILILLFFSQIAFYQEYPCRSWNTYLSIIWIDIILYLFAFEFQIKKDDDYSIFEKCPPKASLFQPPPFNRYSGISSHSLI